MRFSYFKTLSLPWQARVICECGVRLAERKLTDVFIELYQIDSFYAEVYYRHSDSEVIKIASFQELNYLDPYFNGILLPDISPKILKDDEC